MIRRQRGRHQVGDQRKRDAAYQPVAGLVVQPAAQALAPAEDHQPALPQVPAEKPLPHRAVEQDHPQHDAEAELETRREDGPGLDGQQDDGRGRDGIQRQVSPPDQHRHGHAGGHDGRTQQRRLGLGQQQVNHQHHQHDARRPPPRLGQQPAEQVNEPQEYRQVAARNAQIMDRAATLHRLVELAQGGVALADQQRPQQVGGLLVLGALDMLEGQRADIPQVLRKPTAAAADAQAVGAGQVEGHQQVLVALGLAPVELAGVVGPARAAERAHQLHLLARPQIPQRLIHPYSGQAADAAPLALAVQDLPAFQQESSGRRAVVAGVLLDDLRRTYHLAAQAGQHARAVAEADDVIVGQKTVAQNYRGGGGREDAQSDGRGSDDQQVLPPQRQRHRQHRQAAQHRPGAGGQGQQPPGPDAAGHRRRRQRQRRPQDHRAALRLLLEGTHAANCGRRRWI